MPLTLVFIGYNESQTRLYFREFLEANHDQMLGYSTTGGGAQTLDGTRIIRAPNSLTGLSGLHPDQIIVACDRRGVEAWPAHRREMLNDLLVRASTHLVSDENRVIFYDLDAKEATP